MHASPSTRTHLMGLSPASVHIDVGLENMFAMYANRDCIADFVMPVVAVPKKSDKIWSMPVATLQELSNAQLAGSRSPSTSKPWPSSCNTNYLRYPV